MSNYVLTATVGDNSDLFPKILRLYARLGCTIVDPFFGRGVFWSKVDTSQYSVHLTDLYRDGIDARKLPHGPSSVDVVVCDPPYARQSTTPTNIREAKSYNLNHTWIPGRTAGLRKFYLDCAKEAHRILKNSGVVIVKCQDAIDRGQEWNHVWLIQHIPKIGFVCEDLFVLVSRNHPAMRHDFQKHARKNHSYFLVFKKI